MSASALAVECACILLVEDNHEVRAAMRRALAKAGHNVVETGSGDAAATLIDGAVPFDMLITDVRMPGSYDGVALAACWHEKVPGRPVLFVSGHADGRLDMGIVGPHEALLLKPFQRAALLDTVQHLLAKRVTTAVPAMALSGQGDAAPLGSVLQHPLRA